MTQLEAISHQLVTLQSRLGKVEGVVTIQGGQIVVLGNENKVLRDENASLKEENAKMAETHAKDQETIVGQKEEIQKLREQVAWFQRKLFGRMSEKMLEMDKNQLTIPFPEWADDMPDEEIRRQREEADKEIEEQQRQLSDAAAKNKKRGTRDILDDPSLPVRTFTIEPEGADLTRYKKVGEKHTRKLMIDPGRVYVADIVRPVYGLKSGNMVAPEGQKSIIVADLPPFAIDKGLAGNLLLVEIILEKIGYYMPLYRQLLRLAHLGCNKLDNNTVDGWFLKVADLLKPLADKLLQVVVSESGYIQCDETTLPVVDQSKHKAPHEYVWTLNAPLMGLVSYNYRYQGSRGGKVGFELLNGFKGYLQSDDYNVYDSICKQDGVYHVGCLAHCRRYVEKAKDENAELAKQGLYIFQQLYNVEHIAKEKNMTADERKALRQQLSVPMLDALENWCKTTANSPEVKYRPKGLLGQAVAHIIKNMPTLRTYVTDGRLLVDDNEVERLQKNIVCGRKNWMFAGNHEAAERICTLTSLVASCKECGINPREWLLDALLCMAGERDYHWKIDYREMLPDCWKPSEHLKAWKELLKSGKWEKAPDCI